ncbi:MAG TPA: primosomal protein N', partial [candidate division Zixibacteria bacterium]|nr:primosomal protein N' [candidate division Zixibacteria bacterium]
IAVTGPLRKSFTYRIPDTIERLEPGQRVLVPFGRERKIGYYLGAAIPETGMVIKSIIKSLEENSYFSLELFKLCTWMADYYFANPADVFSSALPPSLKSGRASYYVWKSESSLIPFEIRKKIKIGKRLSAAVIKSLIFHDQKLLKKLIEEGAVEEIWPGGMGKSESDESAIALPFIEGRADVKNIVLNEEQVSALTELTGALENGHQVYLLHGVTGSGKTLVYCHLIKKVLEKNQTAVVLTPEIALAGATLAYLRGFFGDDVTVIHSSMTAKERQDSWQGIRNGRYRIVVGPRSAIFAPLPNLGVIVVDEEHDETYKQDEPSPRFQARDSAIMRSKINDIATVLGSASPSIESYYNAKTGRYKLIELTKRPGKATLPNVKIVDMTTNRISGQMNIMSFNLKKNIEACLERNEQVILYLNRRGYSPYIKCKSCGFVPSCPDCKINLTYHKTGKKLSCHYCGKLDYRYDQCPKCAGAEFDYCGTGTQKVEENIAALFEKGRALRFDSDSASGRTGAFKILSEFASGRSNLLLGTQMVTKGLDLPRVSLVGVLSADQSLDLPDFRSTERAFSRLLQVAGRSGRADNKGEVLIQTYYPERDVILSAASQNYKEFYEREIESRKGFEYPPFTRLVNFVFSSTDEKKLEESALSFRQNLQNRIKQNGLTAELLGPAPCPLYMLRKNFRRHLLVKTKQIVKFVKMLTEWESDEPRFKAPAAVKIVVDIDPYDMM